MLDLHLNARSDERFHLQTGEPRPIISGGWFKRTIRWTNLFLPDGTPGVFVSTWMFGNSVHWYSGTVKCDGTRTHMYWWGQLDDGVEPKYTPSIIQYVMTTTPKEMLSVRLFTKPGELVWSNMGGS